ncbi:MAG: fluoride efflux transporter CrcB [Deltaproteobacteria bacterium]|nr:fluoride efflux transporter CrcB [Deltaproteobacteria bacterium]
MKHLLTIGIGGGLGAVARYKLGGLVLHHTSDWKFPAGTLLVNIVGCLAAGLLAGLVEKQDLFGPETRIFLFTGLLGGFTTFSAFGLETIYLFQRHELFLASLNIVLSVLCGLLAIGLGLKMMS